MLDQEANADGDEIDLLSGVLTLIDECLAVPAVITSVGLRGHEWQCAGFAGIAWSDAMLSISLIVLAVKALLDQMAQK